MNIAKYLPSLILANLMAISHAQETATTVAEFGVENLFTSQSESLSNLYNGVVKIEVDSLTPNYASPWSTGRYQSGTGTGFLIKDNLFMTNAHVVRNGERIYVSMYGDTRKIPAKVKFVAHDADLALIEVEDMKPFKGVKPFEFSKTLPNLEDEVRVIGYPIGGARLSVTRGVVSRIDFTHYAHPRNMEHLTLQVDAAINPGNSGGPALMGDKVIGVAFQGLTNANSTGYVIPIPVIQHFLTDIKDGVYDGYVDLGISTTPILNPAMRTALGLPNDDKGLLIGKVMKGGSADGVLQNGDILLKVKGYDVDSSSGSVTLDGQKISMKELIERSFKNDKLPLDIIRNGKHMKVTVSLQPSRAKTLFTAEYDKMPRYVVFGGLVFQPIQLNVLGAAKISPAEVSLDIEDYQENGGVKELEDLVIITQVLDDEVNARLSEAVTQAVVDKINGIKVKGLSHVYQLLYEEKLPEYTIIELKDTNRPLIFDSKTINAANNRIAKTYNIPKNARLSSKIPTQVNAQPNNR